MPAITQAARDYDRAVQAKIEMGAQEDALKMQKLRLDIEKMQEEKVKSQPDYEAKLAGDIAERTGKLQETLNLNRMQRAGIGQRLGDISSASAPLDIDVSGPVLPQQMAMQAGQGLVAEENLLNAQRTRMMAELEAYRKKQEGLVGSVNLGEAYGTAPAGSSADVMRRRVQEQSNMFREARDFINSAQTPEEAQDRANSVSANKAYFDAQTREELKNTRKLPGFEGLAKDEDAARKMRERVPTFVSTVSAIDRLIELGQLTEGMTFQNPVQLARYRAEADQIRIPLVAALRVPLLGGGQMTEQERAFVQSAIANPTDYLNFASIDRLKTLKRTVASEFSSATRNYGFQLKSLQSVIDANIAPSDINTFGVRSQAIPTEKQQPKPKAVYNPATGLLK